MNEQLLILILTLSFVIKVVVDLVKQWTSDLILPTNFHRYTSIVISLALGILLAYEADAGILLALGLHVKDFWVDVGVTGFVLAGGADVIYELVNFVRTKRLSE